jgi:hypothetical protein
MENAYSLVCNMWKVHTRPTSASDFLTTRLINFFYQKLSTKQLCVSKNVARNPSNISNLTKLREFCFHSILRNLKKFETLRFIDVFLRLQPKKNRWEKITIKMIELLLADNLLFVIISECLSSIYSSSQKYSNKHILNHNFFRLESFGFKFSGNLYINLNQILAKIWKF